MSLMVMQNTHILPDGGITMAERAVELMLKKRGMIAVLCVILLLGIVTTATTCHIIDSGAESSASEDTEIYYEPPLDDSSVASQNDDEDNGDGIVSPAGESAGDEETELKYTAKDYEERLNDIDNTIKKMENSDNSNTADGKREAVEYKYRLWDTQLNQIYQSVMDVLSEREADELRVRERRWIRKRDKAAKNASARYKGSSMESVEYTSSLADSTRDRAYELLELYGSYLTGD